MSENTDFDPQPGDVFACPGYRNAPPERVTIERLTATQAIDTDGHRWRRSDGRRVGGSGYIRAWTDKDTAEVEEYERTSEYCRLLDALGSTGCYWHKLPKGARLAASLPHLRAAVEAIGSEGS